MPGTALHTSYASTHLNLITIVNVSALISPTLWRTNEELVQGHMVEVLEPEFEAGNLR